MPASIGNSGSNQSQEDVCSICWNELNSNPTEPLLSHEASRTDNAAKRVFHTFHEECLYRWFEGGFRKCPLCTAVWPGIQIVDLSQLLLEIREGNLQAVKELLASGRITKESRGKAIEEAGVYGHLEIVKELLANGPITEESRGKAIEEVGVYGHLEIVKELLANGPITEESRGKAIEEAGVYGHLEIVKELLASGPISLNHRLLASKQAWKYGQYSILKELLPVDFMITISILYGAMEVMFYVNALKQHLEDQT
jgi:uncharacterized membrane protein